MKNIISFSLWGNNPKYTIGAIENAKLAKDIYPEWKCRFYYDSTVPENIIDQLKNLNCELILKHNSYESIGVLWRFEVGFDNTIDRFIIRDADSRLNLREKYAVDQWIESTLPFHIMRDHYYHYNTNIMAGMWGAVKNFIPNFKELYCDWINNINDHISYHVKGNLFNSDQIFLNNIIWPYIENKHKLHSSNNYNNNFNHSIAEGYFVGQVYEVINGISVPIFNY